MGERRIPRIHAVTRVHCESLPLRLSQFDTAAEAH